MVDFIVSISQLIYDILKLMVIFMKAVLLDRDGMINKDYRYEDQEYVNK